MFILCVRSNDRLLCARPEQHELPRQHPPTCVPHVAKPSGDGLASSVTSKPTALEAFEAMVIFNYEGQTTTTTTYVHVSAVRSDEIYNLHTFYF